MYNNHILYATISNIKKLDNFGFDFKKFHAIMELGLDKDLSDSDFDVNETLNQFKQIMTKIGILPFNFDELPPENPDLF